jgi:hypothetical protein
MRSAFIYIREPRATTLVSHLDSICTKRNGPNEAWLIERDGDPVLYVEFYEKKYWDEIEPFSWEALVTKLGGVPECAICVDVSGRHRGKEDLFGFLEDFLKRYDGVVLDDFTDYSWSLPEILDGKRIDGHSFFEN